MFGVKSAAMERDESALLPFLIERMDVTRADPETVASCVLDPEVRGLGAALVRLVDAADLTAERAAASEPWDGRCTAGEPLHPQAAHQIVNAMLGEAERRLRHLLTELVPADDHDRRA